jgi:hypothetical protein
MEGIYNVVNGVYGAAQSGDRRPSRSELAAVIGMVHGNHGGLGQAMSSPVCIDLEAGRR